MPGNVKAVAPGKWLDRTELETLTAVWETWAGDFSTPARAISRARLHLFFLLVRYAGMRAAEIQTFPNEAKLDIQTGFLQLKERKLFLPPAALRPLRRILSLPEAQETDFLQVDAGFLRRTFYELGRLANLRPDACAPRALRYARARELLDLHMSTQVVATWLGIGNPLQLACLTDERRARRRHINEFTAMVTGIETDFQAGRIFLRTETDIALMAVAPLGELADLEPAPGKPFSVSISPRLLFPAVFPLPVANRLSCLISSMSSNKVETSLMLEGPGGFKLLALLDSVAFTQEDLEPGARIDVYIPASAIRLAAI